MERQPRLLKHLFVSLDLYQISILNQAKDFLYIFLIVYLIIECSLEHNLPDSPFASPTKAAADFFSNGTSETNVSDASASSTNNKLATSTILPATSTLEMASFKSFNCQMPRYSYSLPLMAIV